MRDTLQKRFESHIHRSDDGCWLWTASCMATGYGQIVIERGRPGYAHRVAWELYRGHIPAGMFVCHRCDVTRCVNPDHLFLGTQRDNMADCSTKARISHGERHYRTSFTEQDILDILALAETETHTAIAKRYGVSREAISCICRGENWAHVFRRYQP